MHHELVLVNEVNCTYCSEHFIIYTNTESLCCKSETSMLIVPKKKKRKEKRKRLYSAAGPRWTNEVSTGCSIEVFKMNRIDSQTPIWDCVKTEGD